MDFFGLQKDQYESLLAKNIKQNNESQGMSFVETYKKLKKAQKDHLKHNSEDKPKHIKEE